MQLLLIVRSANLSDAAEQVLLDGDLRPAADRRRLPTPADQHESDEPKRSPTARSYARLSRRPRELHDRHRAHNADVASRFGVPQTRRSTDLCRAFLMGRAGIEPATLGLKVPCSTN